jgi:lysophospholipase L1-like esterase
MQLARRLAPLLAVVAAGLAGCGDSPSDTSPTVDEGPTTVAALGDSITAGSPLWDPNPTIRRQLRVVDPRSQYQYWATAKLGDEAAFRNCGALGERTDEIRDRLDQCAEGAQALIVQGGINDIAQGRPVADAAADLEAMVERGLELGLDTALAEVLPWNDGGPRAAAEIRRLNERIAAIGARQNVPVLPFHETLEDSQRRGRIEPRWTIDGDHPSVTGYRRLGRLIELPLDQSG